MGQGTVTAVTQIIALFALHTVLNDLLNTVFYGVDAKLPDGGKLGIVEGGLGLQLEGIVTGNESYILDPTALGQLKVRIADGLVIELIEAVTPARQHPFLKVTRLIFVISPPKCAKGV